MTIGAAGEVKSPFTVDRSADNCTALSAMLVMWL